MNIEYEQWLFSEKLFGMYHGSTKQNYEFSNIIERLIISMVNSRRKHAWSTVFVKSSMKTPFNKQMLQEIIDKKLTSDPRTLAGDIVNSINKFVAQPEPIQEQRTTINTPNVKYGKFEAIVAPRFYKYSMIDVLKMYLRYFTVIRTGGQQWGMPQACYDNFYHEWGARYEGFASPLNSRLMEYPDAKFCSLFYDVDKPFGSIGSFFDAKIQDGCWVINPPYIASILNDVGEKIIASLKPSKKPLTIFSIMPYWSDMKIIDRLVNISKYHTILQRYNHFYETPAGKKITATFQTIVFAFDNLKNSPNYEHAFDAMLINEPII